MRRRATVLVAALVIDGLFGDAPNRWHPVAWFGTVASRAIRHLPRGGRGRDAASGVALAVVLPGAAGLASRKLERASRRMPAILGILAEAFLLKQALALNGLVRHARNVERPLAVGDLDGARAAAARIVSRDVTNLEPTAVASAAIESTAENLADSVIAPALWYLAGGLPAAWGYRAVNTLDAMVGYRSQGPFGAPAAKLDDLLNIAPSRLAAALVVAASSRPIRAWQGVQRDHAVTPSPNSGWPMAAAAHALDLRLEKQGVHVLNPSGAGPVADDIGRATALVVRATLVGLAGVLFCAVTALRLRPGRLA